jgi:CHAT domain-containing protein
VFLGASGCGRSSRIDRPDVVYQDAQRKFQHGDLAGAYQESDAAFKELSDRDPEWSWRFHVLQAEILIWRGLNEDALQLLAPQLPAQFRAGDIGVRREIMEGLADSSLQKFDDAAQHINEADRLARSYQPDLLGEVALSRGNLAVARGSWASAEAAFLQSFQFARQNNQTFLTLKALGSLGFVSMREEQYDKAIDWDTQALELSRSMSARIVTEKVEGNLAWNYYRMGDLEKSLSLSTDAKGIAIQLGADKDEMLWLRNIGTIEGGQRDYQAAENDYLAALDLANKLGNKGVAGECLHNLAIVELKSGNYDEAERHVSEALNLEYGSNDRSMELYSVMTKGYIEGEKKEFGPAESDFRQVIGDRSSDTYLRWQAEVGLAKVYADANQPMYADEYFRKAMATIEAARSSVRHEELRLSFVSGVVGFYDDYVNFLASEGKTQEALEVSEISRARTLAEGLGIGSSLVHFSDRNYNSRQFSRKANAVLLDYWLGTDHSYLWVIAPERAELFTLPPAAVIDSLVQSYRQALLGSRDVLETQNAAGRKLYDLLVAPGAKMIPMGARVTILPDGSLYGLNFETLLAPSPQLHYWIEDVDVSYANSLTLLAAGASRRAAPAKKLLLVGDPVSPGAEFPKLPQAAAEMSQIENYFPAADRKVFSGAEATPDSYLNSEPAGFSYIHFVAHGTASRASPLDSAVILSKQGDDYKLYAREIIQHPLHADLVTISACHGEGVRTYSGEGLVGLSWAFLRAGAHGVIAALWEVNDNSTPQLMDRLYSEIGKGVPPDAALRDAKLALLHSGGVYRRPFYWAPFELYRGS